MSALPKKRLVNLRVVAGTRLGNKSGLEAGGDSATMAGMKNVTRKVGIAAFLCLTASVNTMRAQVAPAPGTLIFQARITPTAARPEPVRQFTFYILSKSYVQIAKEVESDDVVPPRDQFIDTLTVSKELKAWLKAHQILDLTMPGLDKALTPDDVLKTPEFLLAYQRSNSGGVTNGIPKPRYADKDKIDNPAKYKKQYDEYLAALKKFIQLHPETMSGMELELDAVNPQRKWKQIESNHNRKVQRLAPEVAQTKFLVAKADTDMDGRASVPGLAPGTYWISTLNLEALAGDARLRWDVAVTMAPGQAAHVELTNLNGIDAHAAAVEP
jgi:hypothetical protein